MAENLGRRDPCRKNPRDSRIGGHWQGRREACSRHGHAGDRYPPALSPRESMVFVDQLLGPADTTQVLKDSDVVVLALPETAETENMISTAEINMMKPGSILCNVARGTILDEGALIEALKSGHLSSAILDVQRHEPMEKDDPLWEAPNLYLSPHSAAASGNYGERVESLFAENLRHYVLQGRPSINVVDAAAVSIADAQ